MKNEPQFFLVGWVMLFSLVGLFLLGNWSLASANQEMLELENFRYSLKSDAKIPKISLFEELSGNQEIWDLEGLLKEVKQEEAPVKKVKFDRCDKTLKLLYPNMPCKK